MPAVDVADQGEVALAAGGGEGAEQFGHVRDYAHLDVREGG